jgi:hypothetical protein
MPDDSLRLAVLIDADNASAAVIGDILSEVASLGTASVKRVYGDFTTSNLHSWRTMLLEHAIQPVQQFRNTVGKNTSCRSPIETSPASPIEMSRSTIGMRLVGVAWDDGDHDEPQGANASAGADRHC